jgi:hypothetical protein
MENAVVANTRVETLIVEYTIVEKTRYSLLMSLLNKYKTRLGR